MAKPISMMSVALVTAAVSGFLPQFAPRLSTALSRDSIALALTPAPGGSPHDPTGPAVGGSIKSASTGVTLLLPSGSKPLKLEWNGKVAMAYIFFNNSSNIPQTISFGVLLQDRLGKPLPVKASTSYPNIIDPYSKQLIPLILEPSGPSPAFPAAGYLKIKTKPVFPPCPPMAKCRKVENPPSLDQEILIPEIPEPMVGQIFLVSLAAAALIVLTVGVSFKKNVLAPMGSPSWNFQTSWAANATIASSLLATILTWTIFPEHPHYMPRASYLLLSSLFAALLALAPLVYGLFHRGLQIPGAASQGYVITFLVAGGLVLWGALGQALTLWWLFTEFLSSNSVDLLLGRILQGLATMLIPALIVYGLTSLYTTIKALIDQSSGVAKVAPENLALYGQWSFL